MTLDPAAVLALHQRRSTGMTYNSPDVCTCGARLLPERGDEDATIRRDRAFAHHQVQVLTAAAFVADNLNPAAVEWAAPTAPAPGTPGPSAEDREALALARAAVEGPEPGPREVVPAAEYVRLARVALAARQPAPTVSAVECGNCDGTGEAPDPDPHDERWYPCPVCGGSGEREVTP